MVEAQSEETSKNQAPESKVLDRGLNLQHNVGFLLLSKKILLCLRKALRVGKGSLPRCGALGCEMMLVP